MSRPSLAMDLRCVPGLEVMLQREVASMPGIRGVSIAAVGVVTARGTMRSLYCANRFLRTASRILVPVASLSAHSHNDLGLAVQRLRQDRIEPFLSSGTMAIRVQVARHQRSGVSLGGLSHEANIEAQLHELLGTVPVTDAASSSPRLDIEIRGERVRILVDSSGQPLHERCWKREVGKMPLKSSVAAAMLRAAGWVDENSTTRNEHDVQLRHFFDPFCGSGCIPIEAAQMIVGEPPRSPLRSYALQGWPAFEPSIWTSVSAEAEERTANARRRSQQVRPLLISGSDRDKGVIAAAQRNAVRAGVGDLVTFDHAALGALRPPAIPVASSGLCLTNPPWGLRSKVRNQGGDLRNLYARLGHFVLAQRPRVRLGVLTNDHGLARQACQSIQPHLRVLLGGTKAWLFLDDILAVGQDAGATQSRAALRTLPAKHPTGVRAARKPPAATYLPPRYRPSDSTRS